MARFNFFKRVRSASQAKILNFFRRIMNELQSLFPAEYDMTSSHKLRHSKVKPTHGARHYRSGTLLLAKCTFWPFLSPKHQPRALVSVQYVCLCHKTRLVSGRVVEPEPKFQAPAPPSKSFWFRLQSTKIAWAPTPQPRFQYLVREDFRISCLFSSSCVNIETSSDFLPPRLLCPTQAVVFRELRGWALNEIA